MGISLIPNSPRGEHRERGHGFPVGGGRIDQPEPPIFDGSPQRPGGGIDLDNLEPILDHAPESNGEPTFED